MRILFVDTNSSTPYDLNTLDANSPGGTITAMMLVAGALSRDHDVLVAEAALTADNRSNPRLNYLTLNSARSLDTQSPDVVIVMRKHRAAAEFSRLYPNARIILWIANFQPLEVMIKRRWILDRVSIVVAMSRCHRDQADSRLNHPLAKVLTGPRGRWRDVPVGFVYNAIADDLQPDDTHVDPNKLTMFSTPNKGLSQILTAFDRAKSQMPDLQLYVAGSRLEDMRAHRKLRRFADGAPGVHMLGRLPQNEILQHVRESLCVFYPQYIWPETFGLVYAEANAVGTPVLAHDFGAASEVLSTPEQLVDGRDLEAVVRKLAAWRSGQRPIVRARDRFRASNVAKEWAALLAALAEDEEAGPIDAGGPDLLSPAG